MRKDRDGLPGPVSATTHGEWSIEAAHHAADLCHVLRVFWSKKAGTLALSAWLVLGASACERVKSFLGAESAAPPVNRNYPIVITARSDDRTPIADVQILLGKTVVGRSDASGNVHLSLKGNEGDVATLSAKCPDTYASPEKGIVVGLRHFAPGSPAPRFETVCVPLVRQFVVGIRTENGAKLPIRRLNQVVGQTDNFGIAHLLVQAAARDQVALTIDTSSNPLLRPQNPVLTFVASNRDELVLLEQKFTLTKRIVKVAPKNIPKPL